MVREILTFSSTYDIGDCSFNSAVCVFVVILYGAVYKYPTSLIGSFIVKKNPQKNSKNKTQGVYGTVFLVPFHDDVAPVYSVVLDASLLCCLKTENVNKFTLWIIHACASLM